MTSAKLFVPLDMGGQQIKNLTNGVASGDAATVGQLPVFTGLEFATANSGTWLDVTTTSSDISGVGFTLSASAGWQLEESGGSQVLGLSGAVNVKIGSGGSFNAGNGPDTWLLVSEDGAVSVNLGAGKAFTVFNNAGSPILQMTDGSPDLHIPTGGSVVADL